MKADNVDGDSKQIVVLHPPVLPAARKVARGWKQFGSLLRGTDEILEEQRRLRDVRIELNRRAASEAVPELRQAQLSEMTKVTLARCRALLQQIDREELYEDDTDDDDNPILKQEVLAQRLAVLLACVDTGPTSIEPKGFVVMLLKYVGDAGIGYLALESGCREIEANKKRIHSVAEMLEVLKAHEEQWWNWRSAISRIENDARRLQADIEEAQRLLERERERAKVTQATRAFTDQVFISGVSPGKSLPNKTRRVRCTNNRKGDDCVGRATGARQPRLRRNARSACRVRRRWGWWHGQRGSG